MDKRAADILFSSYWGANGWKRERTLEAEDFAYAKSRGLMFDPVCLNHDQVMQRVLAVRGQIDARFVADAFVFSLGTRLLEYRSALGSYAILRHFPLHQWAGSEKHCRICGSYHRTEAGFTDLNVLNFERLKWGGIRHSQPLYAAFDLEWFKALEPVTPALEHVSLLRAVLQSIEDAPIGTSSASLQAVLPKTLKSNKSERDILIAILGFIGVLETKQHLGFLSNFIPLSDRNLPGRRFVDMAYPACWWTHTDGINWTAARHWFGHLL
jgi:hypothetical protein